jgi:hypothetical protein
MLTATQETEVLAVIATLKAAGFDPTVLADMDKLERVLKVGRLTTEIAEYDARIAVRSAKSHQAAMTADQAIAGFRTRQDALRAELRALIPAE